MSTLFSNLIQNNSFKVKQVAPWHCTTRQLPKLRYKLSVNLGITYLYTDSVKEVRLTFIQNCNNVLTLKLIQNYTSKR